MQSLSKIYKTKKDSGDFILFLILFLLVTSPFFMLSRSKEAIPFILLSIIFIKGGYNLDLQEIILFLIVSAIIAIQGYVWGWEMLAAITYIASSIIAPYFLFKIFKFRIFTYIVKILYFTAITSLILWTMQNIFFSFDKSIHNLMDYFYQYSFDTWPRSLIFYTVALYKVGLGFINIYRNSGIFHEPGRYAIWLILGMGLNTIILKSFINKKNIIMMTALLTTFSTAGYIQLGVLSFYFVWKSKKNIIFKFLILTIFVLISVYLYTSLNFMQEKISMQYQEQSKMELAGTYTTGRFIRIYKILNVIKESPVFGRGIITASIEKNPFSAYYISGAPSLKIFAHFGLFFGFLFFLYYYRGIKKFIKYYNFDSDFAIYLFLSLYLGGFSQDFYYDIMSIQFFFLGIINVKSNIKSVYDRSKNIKILKQI